MIGEIYPARTIYDTFCRFLSGGLPQEGRQGTRYEPRIRVGVAVFAFIAFFGLLLMLVACGPLVRTHGYMPNPQRNCVD